MARPTNSDIIERLEALTGEVAALRGELSALRSALRVDARPAPTRDAVAEASAGGPKATSPAGDPAPDEAADDAPIMPVVDPSSPEELLAELFEAAAMEDAEAGFERFTMMMHPRALDGPRALSSLKAFQWKQLRKNYREYLDASGRFDSFQIIDRRPEIQTPRDETCKLFLHSSRRMPVPLQLRCIEGDPSRWRIEICSL